MVISIWFLIRNLWFFSSHYLAGNLLIFEDNFSTVIIAIFVSKYNWFIKIIHLFLIHGFHGIDNNSNISFSVFVSFIFFDNSSMFFIRTLLIIFYKKVSFRYPLHALSIVFTTRKTLIVNNPILLNFKTLPVFINIFLKI